MAWGSFIRNLGELGGEILSGDVLGALGEVADIGGDVYSGVTAAISTASGMATNNASSLLPAELAVATGGTTRGSSTASTPINGGTPAVSPINGNGLTTSIPVGRDIDLVAVTDPKTGETRLVKRRRRRRRRRLLTAQDKADIGYLVGVLGQGQLGKAAITALLSRRVG